MIAETEPTGNQPSTLGRTLGDEVGLEAPYAVRFPNAKRGGKGPVTPGEIDFEQDEEWCEVLSEGRWQRLRLHDYADIYRAPGLYEHLFAGLLRCSSPQRVVGLLAEVLRDWQELPTDLSVIDLGAGNGMVGEQLRRLGVRGLVSTDIIPEAAEAARRDRPGVYDDYVVADLCDLPEAGAERLMRRRPNCLSTVSALGFGDIPTKAFATAFNLIATPGWLAFNIKESFLNASDASGFARLIHLLAEREIIQVQAYRRYSHRLSVSGRRLNYVAMTARKLREIPDSLLGEVE
jgi:hypothetical protein